MYTQFFGNYLLANAYVTQEELFDAIKKQTEARMKLGTLAIHYGYMTASEVEEVVLQQTHDSRRFGEIAISDGYLTEEQVNSLLQEQSPDFLLLGQVLVDNGVITNNDLENIIADYRSQNEIVDLDMTSDNHDIIMNMIDRLFSDDESLPEESKIYFELLFNNFIRFIGEDFTPLPAEIIDAYPVECSVSQDVVGGYNLKSIVSMDEETAIAFASRYVGDSFVEYDEYVKASLEDFVNLHNGLFIVNISNMKSLELNITAPIHEEGPILEFPNKALHFPVLYSFGIVHFIIEAK